MGSLAGMPEIQINCQVFEYIYAQAVARVLLVLAAVAAMQNASAEAALQIDLGAAPVDQLLPSKL